MTDSLPRRTPASAFTAEEWQALFGCLRGRDGGEPTKEECARFAAWASTVQQQARLLIHLLRAELYVRPNTDGDWEYWPRPEAIPPSPPPPLERVAVMDGSEGWEGKVRLKRSPNTGREKAVRPAHNGRSSADAEPAAVEFESGEGAETE
jgi:hypothetical protein